MIKPNPADARRFERLAKLGSGAMGTVWKARDRASGRLVALKELDPARSLDPTAVERFRREAQSLSRLSHPNIVSFIELLDRAIVMELVEGKPLSALLEAKALDRRTAIEIVGKVARAVHHAHEQGVVHRDLKPANIIIAAGFEPKVADFGVAHLADASLTKTGAFLGTPNYMAPEQATGDAKHTDARTDVYALGAILYEVLTGRPPHEGSVMELIARIASQAPRRPRELDPTVPADLEAIVLRALEKAPSRRHQTAVELASALRDHLDGRAPARPRRGAFALGVLLLVSAATLAVIARSRSEPVPAAPLAPVTSRSAPPAKTWRPLPAFARQIEATPHLTLVEARGALLLRSRHSVNALAVGARGEVVLIAHRNTVETWEKDGSYRELVLERPPGPRTEVPSSYETAYRGAGIAPRASRVLALDEDVAWIADLETGKPLGSPVVGVTCVALRDDGERAALGRQGEVLILSGKGAPVASIPHPGPRPARIAFAGENVLVASVDGSLALHDEAGALRWTVAGRAVDGEVLGLAASADGRLGIIAREGRLACFDLENGEVAWSEPTHDSALQPAFSPDGRLVLVGYTDGKALVRDARTGAIEESYDVHERQVTAVSFGPEGERILGTFCGVRRLRKGDTVAPDPLGHRGVVLSVAFSPDGTRAVSGGLDGTVRLWDMAGDEGRILLAGREPVESALFTEDGEGVVFVSHDRLTLLSARTGEVVRRLPWIMGGRDLHRVAPGLVLAAGMYGAVLFSPATGKVTRRFEPNLAPREWVDEAGEPNPLAKLASSSSGAPSQAALAVSGDHLVTATDDGTLSFWRLSTGALLRSFPDPVVIGLGNHPIALFRDESVLRADRGGLRLIRPKEHDHGTTRGSQINCETMCALGDERVVVPAEDGVCLWKDGAELERLSLVPLLDSGTSAAVSPDGKTVLVGTDRGLLLRIRVE